MVSWSPSRLHWSIPWRWSTTTLGHGWEGTLDILPNGLYIIFNSINTYYLIEHTSTWRSRDGEDIRRSRREGEGEGGRVGRRLGRQRNPFLLHSFIHLEYLYYIRFPFPRWQFSLFLCYSRKARSGDNQIMHVFCYLIIVAIYYYLIEAATLFTWCKEEVQ